MTTGIIVIEDHNPGFASRLTDHFRRVRRDAPEIRYVRCAGDITDRTDLFAAALWLCRASSRDAQHIRDRLARGLPVAILNEAAEPAEISGFPSLPVYQSAARMVQQIEQLIASPDCQPAASGISERNLLICAAFLNTPAQNAWMRVQLQASVRSSKITYYCPLMSLTTMRLVEANTTGQTLADLLLQLADQPLLPAEALGPCLQLHSAGYRFFRLPERADDLILCDPELLRRFVLSFAALIHQAAEPAIGFLDCQGLPLQLITRLAVLCDEFVTRIPTGADFSSAIIRQELSMLLSQLPNSCRIREIPATLTAEDAAAGNPKEVQK